MKKWIFGLLGLFASVIGVRGETDQLASSHNVDVLVIIGAPGTEEYGRHFSESVADWEKATAASGGTFAVIGTKNEKGGDAQELKKRLSEQLPKTKGALWLVLIGHGSFDGRDAKFNLRGPDLSAAQLGEWLKPLKREIVFIHTGSASGPFVKSVSGPGRICVSATKSADEVFYARFGGYFSKVIGGMPEADIDQDKQVSVLEAFLHASKQVAQFYETEERLATEHALLDDNGDGVGTRSEIFVGVKSANAPAGSFVDGDRARQVCLVLNAEENRLSEEKRQARDSIEREVQVLNGKKSSIPEASYYIQMESLLLKLGRLYEGT
jgi:hypothetical protein